MRPAADRGTATQTAAAWPSLPHANQFGHCLADTPTSELTGMKDSAPPGAILVSAADARARVEATDDRSHGPKSADRRSQAVVGGADESDLRRLTTDAEGPVGTTDPIELGARFPKWTRDGHIVFMRGNAAETEPAGRCGSWTATAAIKRSSIHRTLRP